MKMQSIVLRYGYMPFIIALVGWTLTACSSDGIGPDPIPVFPTVFEYGEEEYEVSTEGEMVDIVSNVANNSDLELLFITDAQVIDEESLQYFKDGRVGSDMSLTTYLGTKCRFVSVKEFADEQGCGTFPDDGTSDIPIGNCSVKYYRSPDDGKNHVCVAMPKLENRKSAQICLYFFDKDKKAGALIIYQWDRNY